MPRPLSELVIEDETLRDGLQNEKRRLSTDEKLGVIRGLEADGVRRIQVGSFVHPKWMPQMADTDELFAPHLPRPSKSETRAEPKANPVAATPVAAQPS